MRILAIIWLVLSVYIIIKWLNRMMKKTIDWSGALLAVQTPILGLVVFPKYLGATQEVADALIVASIVLMMLSFLIYFIQIEWMKHKNMKKTDVDKK